MPDEWLVWQLADASFPAGGLGHSGALEAASKWDDWRGVERLEDFVHDQLTQTAHSLIPPLQAVRNDPAKAFDMDQFCQAFLSNHVANRASRAQGKAFVLSTEAAFGLAECHQLREDIQARRMHGHFPVVFGAVTAGLKIEAARVTRLFLFITLRGLISSGIRLGLVGPLEGQALIYRLHPFLEALAERCRQFGPEDMAQTAPLIELFQAGQDRLYSRLFQS
jgi:urease accessory protein